MAVAVAANTFQRGLLWSCMMLLISTPTILNYLRQVHAEAASALSFMASHGGAMGTQVCVSREFLVIAAFSNSIGACVQFV